MVVNRLDRQLLSLTAFGRMSPRRRNAVRNLCSRCFHFGEYKSLGSSSMLAGVGVIQSAPRSG